jgi:hypothetical protein
VDKRSISIAFPYGKSDFLGKKYAHMLQSDDFWHQPPETAKKHFPFTNNWNRGAALGSIGSSAHKSLGYNPRFCPKLPLYLV